MTTAILILAAIGFAAVIAAAMVGVVWTVNRVCAWLTADSDIDPRDTIYGAMFVAGMALLTCFALAGVFSNHDRIIAALAGGLPV